MAPKFYRDLSALGEIECDMEYVALDVDSSHISAFKDIPNKPGYVEVFFGSREHKRKMEEVVEKINKTIVPIFDIESEIHIEDVLSDDGHLNSYKERRVMQKIISGTYTLDYNVPKLIRELTGLSVSLPSPLDENKLTKASVSSGFKVCLNDKVIGKIYWDNVLAYKLQWWPQVAEEWVTRDRKWPKKEAIDSLTTKRHVIAKPSDENKQNENTIEHRYSFALIERELALLRSEQQNFVHVLHLQISFLQVSQTNFFRSHILIPW